MNNTRIGSNFWFIITNTQIMNNIKGKSVINLWEKMNQGKSVINYTDKINSLIKNYSFFISTTLLYFQKAQNITRLYAKQIHCF
jgi:hypothetical protein